MNFDHPVLVSSVTLHRYGYGSPTGHVVFYLDRDGEWEQVGEWTWRKGVDPDSGDFVCTFARSFWSSKLMLSMPYGGEENRTYPTLCNVRV